MAVRSSMKHAFKEVGAGPRDGWLLKTNNLAAFCFRRIRQTRSKAGVETRIEHSDCEQGLWRDGVRPAMRSTSVIRENVRRSLGGSSRW